MCSLREQSLRRALQVKAGVRQAFAGGTVCWWIPLGKSPHLAPRCEDRLPSWLRSVRASAAVCSPHGPRPPRRLALERWRGRLGSRGHRAAGWDVSKVFKGCVADIHPHLCDHRVVPAGAQIVLAQWCTVARQDWAGSREERFGNEARLGFPGTPIINRLSNNGLERTRRVGVPATRAVVGVSPCRSTRCYPHPQLAAGVK